MGSIRRGILLKTVKSVIPARLSRAEQEKDSMGWRLPVLFLRSHHVTYIQKVSLPIHHHRESNHLLDGGGCKASQGVERLRDKGAAW